MFVTDLRSVPFICGLVKANVTFKFTTASLGALGFVTVFIQCNLSVSYLFLCVSVYVCMFVHRGGRTTLLSHTTVHLHSAQRCVINHLSRE